MKNIVAIIIVFSTLVMSSCADDKEIGGQWHSKVGLATEDKRHPCVKYDFVVGNLIWSIVLANTIIAPVYFIGWSLYEPVREKCRGCFKNYIETGKASCQ